MRFWQQQHLARAQTLRLLLCFAVLVLGLVCVINAVLALLFKLVMPFYPGWPALFFETNTAIVVLFVLGGCWVESWRLRDGGGVRVAHWMGGVEVQDTGDALNRRLLNVVDEMALASGQPLPQVFVLPREGAINAFVVGWTPQTSALCVTRGALDRLTRNELQGLVAHEFGHLAEADGRLGMRLLALVWGLSLVHGWGASWMQADDQGRVHPIPWLIGAAVAAVGWLGWLAGRILQAAVSRQREFLADARAVQYTRSRDGLGQVLRKVWHERQVATARLHHPHADALSFLWLTDGGWAAPWLATHPPLADRIHRLYGGPRAPLPATAGRSMDEPVRLEPRNDSTVARLAPPLPPASDPSPVSPPRRLPDVDTTEALGRLQRLSGPLQRRMALLAFMMRPDNEAEQRFWMQSTRDLHGAAAILADVQSLPAVWRVPEFERQLAQMAYEGVEQRRALVVATRELLRADGKVSARDRLWWLALRHRMGEVNTRHAFIRPVTGQGRDLVQLNEEERAHVAQFTAYLARLLPVESSNASPSAEGRAWFKAVMGRCYTVGEGVTPPECLPPDADALMHALSGVQELSWMMRPQLVRAWVEEALNHSPGGLLSPDTADALRLTAGLLDTPLPPALAAHYPKP
ncbi:MAG TPA: M48 family metalloprotease [Aquabacterium sp.]|uniref:M48 family metalloprotease n=1 Tax=Aquabacterium sp. TaxID=1872578 RepID=UPI002E368515|nr:M48 family metalloprotease [Aquabacterium sp.]HEX5373335.1 M48 family metalloprotease [Aquabacterium sp.]